MFNFSLSIYIYVAFVLLSLSSKIFAEAGTSAIENIPALRDPTQPINYRRAVIREKPLVLQAIFSGNGKQKAIINGTAVKKGETINGKIIVDITNDHVVYKSSDDLRVLKLRQSIFDK